MEKGKLIEQGKHDELIKLKGTYYDLYDQELKILEYKQQRSPAHA
jgi:ABC-type multidrug transport system fused ATPase/permease subunit